MITVVEGSVNNFPWQKEGCCCAILSSDHNLTQGYYCFIVIDNESPPDPEEAARCRRTILSQ